MIPQDLARLKTAEAVSVAVLIGVFIVLVSARELPGERSRSRPSRRGGRRW